MAEPSLEEVPLPAPPGAPAEASDALLALPAGASADEPAAGVLVVPDGTGCDEPVRAALARLAAAGFAALAPRAPAWLADPAADCAAEWSAFAARPDRDEVRRGEAALAVLAEHPRVDADRVGVVGLGAGGTLAFLLGCASRGVAAVVVLGGRVVYPELSAAKPVQPLELALNLGAPVLGLFGEADPAVPLQDRDALRDRLTQFAVRCEVRALPGAGHGFSNPSRGGYHEPAARDAWERTLRFLGEELAAT